MAQKKVVTEVPDISSRNRLVTEEYLSNGEATLESIGSKYGLTRERVRQIVNKTTKGEITIEEIKEMRHRDSLRRTLMAAERIVEQNPDVASFSDLAKALGKHPQYFTENKDIDGFSELMEEVGRRRDMNRMMNPRKTEKQFSDNDIYKALRRVSKALKGSAVTNPNYTAMRNPDEPSLSIINVRMGSLINACEKAGVLAGAPRPKRSAYGRERIMDSIARCAKTYGVDIPMLSFAKYSDWAALNSEPSGSRVRQIFSNWKEAKLAVVKAVEEAAEKDS